MFHNALYLFGFYALFTIVELSYSFSSSSSFSTYASASDFGESNSKNDLKINIHPLMKKHLSSQYRERVNNYVNDLILLENSNSEMERTGCLHEGRECYYSILYDHENQSLHEALQKYINSIYKKLVDEEKEEAFSRNNNTKLQNNLCLLNDSNHVFLHSTNRVMYGRDFNFSEFENTIDSKDLKSSEIYVQCDFKFLFAVDGKRISVYWRNGDNLWQIAKEIREFFDLGKYDYPKCSGKRQTIEKYAFCIDDHVVMRLTKVQTLEEVKRRDQILKRYERIFYEYLPLFRYDYQYEWCIEFDTVRANKSNFVVNEIGVKSRTQNSIITLRNLSSSTISSADTEFENPSASNLKSVFSCESTKDGIDKAFFEDEKYLYNNVHFMQLHVELHIDDFYLHFVDFDVSKALWAFREFYHGMKGFFTFQDNLNFLKATILAFPEYIPVVLESLRQVLFQEPLFLPTSYLYTNLLYHMGVQDVRKSYGVEIPYDADEEKNRFPNINQIDKRNSYYLYDIDTFEKQMIKSDSLNSFSAKHGKRQDFKKEYFYHLIETYLNITFEDSDEQQGIIANYEYPPYHYHRLQHLEKSKKKVESNIVEASITNDIEVVVEEAIESHSISTPLRTQNNSKTRESKQENEKYLNPDNVIIVTVATEDRPNLQLLKASIEANGYNLIVIGKNRAKYVGNGTKLFILQEFLHNLLLTNSDDVSRIENKLFVFLDAYDVLLLPSFGSTLNRIFTQIEQANKEILENYFQNPPSQDLSSNTNQISSIMNEIHNINGRNMLQLPIIFGAEDSCSPDPSLRVFYEKYADLIYPSPDPSGISYPLMPNSNSFTLLEKANSTTPNYESTRTFENEAENTTYRNEPETRVPGNAKEGEHRYLNSGTYVGKLRDIVTMIDYVCEDLKYYYGRNGADFEEDGDQRWITRYMFRRPGSILIDKYSTLFRCLYSTDATHDYQYNSRDGLLIKKTNSSPAVVHGNGGSYHDIFPLIKAMGWPPIK